MPRITSCIPVLIALLLPFAALGQNEGLLDQIVAPIQVDGNGNPLNNGLNANNARFGNWYYLDAQEEVFYCRRYDNGELIKQQVKLNGQLVDIVPSSQVQVSQQHSLVASVLEKTDIQFMPQKGCAFVCDAYSPNIYAAIPFGVWSQEELNSLYSISFNTPSPATHVTLIWK